MLRRLAGDLRALGWWAPVRAWYEISTRLGVTGRINRRRAMSAGPAPSLASPFTRRIPTPEAASLGRAAAALAKGEVPVFGTAADFRAGPDWHWSETGDPWPRVPWWRVPVRPRDARDIKYVFELGRHEHLVTLAAATAPPDGPDHVTTIETHLRTWFAQNEPEIGVHWVSNLELALRAISWLRVYDLVGHRLAGDVVAAMADHLYHSARHLVAELPYTLSSMRNNHLIGDAVGLVAIGSAFPGDRKAAGWVRRGDRLLIAHLPDHVHDDGATIEDSLGYRAFVLDLLTVRLALPDPPPEVTHAAALLAAHLHRLGAGVGPVPHFGDWDGGAAGATSAEHQPHGAMTRAAAFSGEPPSPIDDGSDTGGGIGRLQSEPWTVWLKCTAGESHGHADLLSVAVAHHDRWVVGDPGNGSYNRAIEQRDYFRGSAAHNVLRVADEDQRVPHRRFRWRHLPAGRLGEPFDVGPFRVMWGTHDAYRRLDEPRSVLRACLVSPSAVIVADWLDAPAPWQLSVLIHPDVGIERTAPGTISLVTTPGRLELMLPGAPEEHRGQRHPYRGWWADDYDAAEPASELTTAGSGAGPVLWGLVAGDAPGVVVDGAALVVEGRRLRPTFATEGEPRLEVSD